MSTPSNQDLEREFSPGRPRDLSHDDLQRVREHSKRLFGNQDRLEVAVAIARTEIDRVNATDLARDVDVAVNRIRAQLLGLASAGFLVQIGQEGNGKKMLQRVDRADLFWEFVVEQYGRALFGDEVRTP